jgi:hypothetical protein
MGTVNSGLIAKLIGVDSEHVSRFHSRRGEVCKPGQLFALPALFWARLFGNKQTSPWMAPRAVAFLERELSPQDVLLELGSGKSTAWYADRVGRVVSLEPNPDWAQRVSCDLATTKNAEVRAGMVSELFPATLHELHPTVLIVDHSDEPELSRPEAIRIALHEWPLPRIIVLDDSDRRNYAAADDLLKGWSKNQFTGFRDSPMRLTETTVFVRH